MTMVFFGGSNFYNEFQYFIKMIARMTQIDRKIEYFKIEVQTQRDDGSDDSGGRKEKFQ